MSQYPNYMLSRTPWINKVPSHWVQCTLKHVIDDFVAGGTPSTSEPAFWADDTAGTPWVAIGDMSNRDTVLETSKRLTPAGLIDKRLSPLPAGSVLYSMYASVGFAAILEVPAVTNQAILGLAHDQRVDSRYLRAFLNAARPHVLREASSNTQDNLNAEKVKNLPFILPPRDEQIAIAAYLDAETARIDGLIDEKRRLSGALAELRASVIGEAIQRGLRPDAKGVETGVPWLGVVPAHWRVLRLKHLLETIEQGWSPQCDGRQAEDHEWGVLKAGACNGGVFHPGEQKALPAGMSGDSSIEVKPGDVLMSRASGSLDLVGSVAHVDDVRPGLMLSDKIFRLKIDESQGTSAKWLAMVFNTPSQRRQIASHVGGAEGLARNITSSAIKELWLAVPPPDEQLEVVAYVAGRLTQIDALTKTVDAEIALLQELRSATITDAVLGRIDVRSHMKS